MPSDPSVHPDPIRPGPKTRRARILMPIALAVAALAVFLMLFWPEGRGKKGSKGYSGDGRGGSSSSRSNESPVGGGDSRERPHNGAKGGWWYSDKPEKSKKEGGWWYQDGPEGSGTKKEPVDDSRSPVGGQ